MIYQIYKTCHSDKYTSKISLEDIKNSKNQIKISKIKQKTEYLLPYRIPKVHYQDKKLDQSIQMLNKSLESAKQENYQLARKILFTNSKLEARRFLHKTRQMFGIKNAPMKQKSQHKPNKKQNKTKQQKKKIRNSTEASQKQKQDSCLFDIQNFKPNFSLIIKKQSLQSRQQRRKKLGITEADLDNYQKSRRGLPSQAKRKNQSTNKHKDFKKMNMKGFTAKISASLGLKQNVNTSTLTRFMNVDMGRQTHSVIDLSQNLFKNMSQLQRHTAKYGY